VSYLNAVPETLPSNVDISIFSPAVSYLNAIPEPANDQFVVSPLVSYKNQ
jgi:hypothetical protein